MTEAKKDIKQPIFEREHAKIVGRWVIKEKSALRGPEKSLPNSMPKILHQMI